MKYELVRLTICPNNNIQLSKKQLFLQFFSHKNANRFSLLTLYSQPYTPNSLCIFFLTNQKQTTCITMVAIQDTG